MLSEPIQIGRSILGAQLSRHPKIATMVKRRFRDVSPGRDEVAYSQYIYSAFRPLCRGGRTLEIGPGSGVGVSLLLARDGCEAVAMDIVDLRTAGLEAGYRELLDGSNAQVEYLLGWIEDIPLAAGSFDFVFSNSALEHVRDPARALQEVRRILRKGGRTAHQIDFRDHRNFEDPLRFLRYGDRLWGLMNSTGPGHQNRWRFSEYMAAFRKLGFKNISVEVNMTAEAAYMARGHHFAPRYRDLSAEDLATLSARIVADV